MVFDAEDFVPLPGEGECSDGLVDDEDVEVLVHIREEAAKGLVTVGSLGAVRPVHGVVPSDGNASGRRVDAELLVGVRQDVLVLRHEPQLVEYALGL